MVVQGSGSAAATSVAIPTHQAGDMIIVAARGTAAAPSVPAAGGTVPAWATLQTGLANACGLTVVAFVATGSTHTTGTFTNATHIAVLVLRPAGGAVLTTAAARSSVGNGNNTQTIIYPALTLADADGSSWGVRIGTRLVAITAVGTPPTNWVNQIIQPAGASALMSVHTRAAVTTNPAADTVTVTSSNAAYRAVTIEILEVVPQTISVGGVGSPQAFGAIRTIVRGLPSGVASAQAFGVPIWLVHQKTTPTGVPPTGYVTTIVRTTTLLVTKTQTITGGKRVATLGAPNVAISTGNTITPAGLGSAQNFGTLTIKATVARAVTGVGSAQAFGAVTPKAVFRATVTGISSAQSFGAPSVRGTTTRAVAGIPSAQAFSTITIKIGTITSPNAGVASPAAFGTLRFWLKLPLAGVPSAQAFGAPKFKLKGIVGGISSAQAFGAVTLRSGFTKPVPGVPSAQAFGTVRPSYGVRAPGLGSPQTFGAISVHAEITKAVAGIGSAQQFGVLGGRVRNLWIWPTTIFPSTGGSLCGRFICGDGHTVGGWDYLPATGRVATLELEPHEVSTLDLEPTLVK